MNETVVPDALGGASGLGRHLAEELHRQGVILVIADIAAQLGNELVKELNGQREK